MAGNVDLHARNQDFLTVQSNSLIVSLNVFDRYMKPEFDLSSKTTQSLFLIDVLNLETKDDLVYDDWRDIIEDMEERSKYSNLMFLRDYAYCVRKEILQQRSMDVLAKYLRVHRMLNSSSNTDISMEIFDMHLDLFVEFNSQDSSLLMEFLNTNCVSNELKDHVFTRFLRFRKPNSDNQMLDYILRIANKARFDFWGMWSDKIYEDNDLTCPVTAAIWRGNAVQTTKLLQYGFKINIQRMELFREYSRTLDIKPFTIEMDSRCIAVMELLLILFTSYLIQDEHLKECLTVLWRSTTSPHIKSFELRQFVAQITEQESINDATLYLSELCSKYELLFPEESGGPLEPRSLKHLCRCSVRQGLRKTWCLPNGIETLEVPREVNDYLMLKE